MIFRDLAIHLGDAANIPVGHSELQFHELTYHVGEGLLVHLLRELENKHFLPDAAKLNVTFGPDVNQFDYSCCLSVAQIWINEVDFVEFFALDDAGRDRWVLGHLRNAIIEAAKRQGASCDVVERAVTKAQAEGLQLRYRIKKLSRAHPGRKLEFNVVRSIHRGGESWFLEVCDRAGQLQETFPILEDTYHIRAASMFRKSRWRGDTFLLTDSGGRIRFQKSSKLLVKKYAG